MNRLMCTSNCVIIIAGDLKLRSDVLPLRLSHHSFHIWYNFYLSLIFFWCPYIWIARQLCLNLMPQIECTSNQSFEFLLRLLYQSFRGFCITFKNLIYFFTIIIVRLLTTKRCLCCVLPAILLSDGFYVRYSSINLKLYYHLNGSELFCQSGVAVAGVVSLKTASVELLENSCLTITLIRKVCVDYCH